MLILATLHDYVNKFNHLIHMWKRSQNGLKYRPHIGFLRNDLCLAPPPYLDCTIKLEINCINTLLPVYHKLNSFNIWGSQDTVSTQKTKHKSHTDRDQSTVPCRKLDALKHVIKRNCVVKKHDTQCWTIRVHIMEEMSQKYHGKFPQGTVPTKATTYRMTEKFYAQEWMSGTMKTLNVNKSLELV